jgi:hypothetical protein
MMIVIRIMIIIIESNEFFHKFFSFFEFRITEYVYMFIVNQRKDLF